MVHTKDQQQERRMSLRHSLFILVVTLISFGFAAMPAIGLEKEFIAEKIPNVPNQYPELFTDFGHSVGFTSIDPDALHDESTYYHRKPDGTFSVYTKSDSAHQGDIAVSNAGRIAFLDVKYDKVEVIEATVSIIESDGETVVSHVLPLESLNVESPYLTESNIERFHYIGLGFDDSETLYVWGSRWTSRDGSRPVVFENSSGVFSATVFESIDSHSVMGIDGTGALYVAVHSYTGCRMVTATVDDLEPRIITNSEGCITTAVYNKDNVTRSGEFLTGSSPLILHSKDANNQYRTKKVRVKPKKRAKQKAKNKYFFVGAGSVGGRYLAGFVEKKGPALQSKERPSNLRHRKMLNRITIKPQGCRLERIFGINSHDEMLVSAKCREDGKRVQQDMLVKPIVK